MFDNIMFDEEILFTYIGYAAGLATILTFAIQILRIIETKNVTNLSSYCTSSTVWGWSAGLPTAFISIPISFSFQI